MESAAFVSPVSMVTRSNRGAPAVAGTGHLGFNPVTSTPADLR